MNWSHFIYFAVATVLLWSGAIVATNLKIKSLYGEILSLFGVALLALFIILFWIEKGEPPLRTMGETRLWYSLFIGVVGYVTYRRWSYKWILSYTLLVAQVFIFVNLLKPEIHTTNLMPALQSLWFVPHVTVYILSYALLGAATIASLLAIAKFEKRGRELLPMIDNLVYVGSALLLMGMFMGALWAKEAWGDFWSWDPKEVWAFITAAFYLLYIHLRRIKFSVRLALWLLPFSFILLMITWIGINWLPAAAGSVHIY
ncbi:MAG: cytochrome c biogenesis protein CcsA [Bacteroidales bacterium]|jgi:ABC-type transport system involved in cytochrome c biogenesis permease subunit